MLRNATGRDLPREVLAVKLDSLPEEYSCRLCEETIPAHSGHWRLTVLIGREVVVERVHVGEECPGVQARRLAA